MAASLSHPTHTYGARESDSAVGNILRQHGIDPAPDRKRQATWKTFIKSHWDVLVSVDFTTIEVWTKGGLMQTSESGKIGAIGITQNCCAF